jgi:hypothetical protein
LRYGVYLVDVDELAEDSAEGLIEPNQGLVEVFGGKAAKHGVDVLSFRSDGHTSCAIDMADGDRSPGEEVGEVMEL